jgi:hypothetical protein
MNPSDTLSSLHRIAAHVLARRRSEVSGRFGLRASPGGIATPAFGDGPEVVRLAGPDLVRETGGSSAAVRVMGSTLRRLAEFAGTDLDAAFTCGDDTPGVGDPDAVLVFDAARWKVLAEWYDLGWRSLDAVLAKLPAEAEPAVLQLWPEHLDVGTSLGLPSGERVNLGFSPGDSFSAEPYAYVGPWGEARPGDAGYWNAPFGAVLGLADAGDGSGRRERCIAFLQEGLDMLSSAGEEQQ